MTPAERDSKIVANRPLAWSIATSFARSWPGIPFDDLRSFAILGLIQAVDMFDPERGGAWSSFAWIVIRRTIGSCIRRETRFFRPLGTASEPAEGDENETNHADENKFPDPTHTVANTDAGIDTRALHARLLARLKMRDKRIVRQHFEDELTLAEIAAREALTEGRVSQLIADALDLMRRRDAPNLDRRRALDRVRQARHKAKVRALARVREKDKAA